jgi:hypothetical protein
MLLAAPAADAATFNGFSAPPTVVIGTAFGPGPSRVSGDTPEFGYNGPQDTVGVGSYLTCRPGSAQATGNFSYRYRWQVTDTTFSGNYVPITGLGVDDANDGDNTYQVTSDELNHFVGCIVDVVDNDTESVMGSSYLNACFPWPYTSQAEVYVSEGPLLTENTFFGNPYPIDELEGPGDTFKAGDPLSCWFSNYGDVDPSTSASYSYRWFYIDPQTGNPVQVSTDGQYYPTADDIQNARALYCAVDVQNNDGPTISTVDETGRPYRTVFSTYTPTVYLRQDFDKPVLSIDEGAPATYGKTLRCTPTTPLEETAFSRYRIQIALIRSGSDIVIEDTDTHTITQADEGKIVTCAVIGEYANGDEYTYGYGASADEIYHVEAPSMEPVIRIVGDVHIGETLTCEPGTWDTGAATPRLVSKVGKRSAGDCATYTVQEADNGLTIRCISELVDGEALIATASSAPTNPVSPRPMRPFISFSPGIGGEPQEGVRLVCNLGASTEGLNGGSFTTQWLLDGKPAAGDADGSFTLRPEHVGHMIACSISYRSESVAFDVTTQALTVRSAQPAQPAPEQPLAPCAPTSDLIIGTDGDDVICAGAGNDIVYAGAGNDQVTGGPGNDVVYAGAGDDRVRGGGGSDSLYGQGGDDQLIGEAGQDDLRGGAGDDALSGGDASDKLQGQAGDDRMLGGIGSDYLSGGDGDDAISGSAGQDTIFGGRGDDRLHGGMGADQIFGLEGDDLMTGDAGNDRLAGGSGADQISGGSGIDHVLGGPGADQISGGPGVDMLIGNGGLDTFSGVGAGDVVRQGLAH